jgi:hypothetical protein
MITELDNYMYGDHMYDYQRVLIICNTELDSMAMMHGIYHIGSLKDALCVSAPDVSEDKDFFWISRSIEFLSKFQSIIICPGIDERGIKFREICFEMLTNFNIQWIDLNIFLNVKKHSTIDDLLNTQGKKAVADLMKHVEKPYHSCGMLAKKIVRDNERDMFFTGFYGLDRACKFKLGELAVLAGESNDGKTTIMRQFMIFAVRNNFKLGCMFGEETNSKFMDLTIRQAYHGSDNFETSMDIFGDNKFTPKFEIEDRFKTEFGDAVNLFQVDRVREVEKIGTKIIDWICHCSDIEGRTAFFIDNLMKVTADEESDEYRAQAAFIEKLYRTAQKKGVFIMMIVHTKKITGLIDQNSIHGTKKIYNTPDHVLFFQRMDRFSKTKEMTAEQADKKTRFMTKIPEHVNFTSFMWAHKIRDRNPNYKSDAHALEYDFKTTCSTELLSKYHGDRVHKYGWSRIVSDYAEDDRPQKI